MFQPFNDRVLIRPDEKASNQNHDGLRLPDAAVDKPPQGTVIAVGPGYLADNGVRTPIQCGPNDRVYYAKNTGTEIELDGETLLILHESELLGKHVE